MQKFAQPRSATTQPARRAAACSPSPAPPTSRWRSTTPATSSRPGTRATRRPTPTSTPAATRLPLRGWRPDV